jgi:enterochelin esterase-like enzyme
MSTRIGRIDCIPATMPGHGHDRILQMQDRKRSCHREMIVSKLGEVELTGGGLIALLFVVALGATCATVWLWPRYAGHTARPALTRTGLLVGSQTTLILAIVAWLNSYFIFYATWGDLFGNEPPRQVSVKTAGTARHIPYHSSASSLWSKARQRDPQRYGRLEDVHVPGARTGFDQQAYVLLPPEYFQPRFAQRRFPVVVMLTGYPGSTKSLIRLLRLPDWVEKGRAGERLQPAIYVMMTPNVAMPRDTECTDVPGGPQVASYFALDVPQALAARYRTATSRDGWGIMGDSTGGYCAAKIAMIYSDRYGSAVNISGDFRAVRDMTTGDLWGGSTAVRNANDLLWRLQHLPPPPINLLITSSRVGEKNYQQCRRFMTLARRPLDLSEIFLETGGHNYDTWARVFPSVLEWMSRHQKVTA